jgi:hypothetical protein
MMNTRGRLVRQNAFDFDDEEVENLPDLNDNLELVSYAYGNAVSAEAGPSHGGESVEEQRSGVAGPVAGTSFDSGLGDLTPSNRTTHRLISRGDFI